MTEDTETTETTTDTEAATSAAERIRSLSTEADRRGSPMISARAMQSRLFEVYDAVAVEPAALDLVQVNLKRTLERTWFSAAEIEQLAAEVEAYLAAPPAAEGEPEPVA